MVSIGMVIDKTGLEEEIRIGNIMMKEVKLPQDIVLTDTYIGLDNRIFEEIEGFLRRAKLSLDYKDYEMVAITAEGKETVLDNRNVVEDYFNLLKYEVTSITIRPVTLAV